MSRPLPAADLSQTISFARLALIVGLVFLHYESFPNSSVSPFRGFDPESHQLATFVNSFVLFFFFSVVPLLSMVSGWLFFSFSASPRQPAGQALATRIRRRFQSLYVPLLFWNALFLGAMAALFGFAPDHPLLAQLNIDFRSARAADYLNAVFGATAHPIAFQFWFVRDLFLSILISPLLWLAMRTAPVLGIGVLALAWITDHDLWIFFRTDVLFFFFLGGLIRVRGWPITVSWRTTLVFLAIYLLLVTLRTAAPLILEGHAPLLAAATRAMRLFGVVACWGLFLRLASTGFGRAMAAYGGLAFFLHAAHYPLLAEIKILLWPLLPAQTDGWMLAHYAASVSITIGLGLAAGVVLARLFPRSFALLNGGRAALG